MHPVKTSMVISSGLPFAHLSAAVKALAVGTRTRAVTGSLITHGARLFPLYKVHSCMGTSTDGQSAFCNKFFDQALYIHGDVRKQCLATSPIRQFKMNMSLNKWGRKFQYRSHRLLERKWTCLTRYLSSIWQRGPVNDNPLLQTPKPQVIRSRGGQNGWRISPFYCISLWAPMALCDYSSQELCLHADELCPWDSRIFFGSSAFFDGQFHTSAGFCVCGWARRACLVLLMPKTPERQCLGAV